ncbi:RFESD protein, partial [Amia calva]|nr:RFESD protein [Amia calva]
MASGKAEDGDKASADSWRLIGPATELSKKQCRLMYSSLGCASDLCLFHIRGEFYAMEARCAHSGGPLCEGDIEEADGVLQVFCPWHDYDFDIRTGKSQTGLQVRDTEGSTSFK